MGDDSATRVPISPLRNRSTRKKRRTDADVFKALKDLGKTLRELRERKRMSADELPTRSGIKPKRIIQLESGERSPLINELEPLARSFGLEPEALAAKLLGARERKSQSSRSQEGSDAP
jgi:ribosome-binding protein aMBF1 (putative translation factor)